MVSVLASILLSLSPPIYVKVQNVNNLSKIEKVGDRPITFGVQETVEEILINQGYALDSNGMAVDVSITDVSSPQRILTIAGLKWLKKDYIVTTSMCIGTGCFEGKAVRHTYVFAALLDVENNEVPLNKKAFSKALQKSLEDAATFKNNINNK
jgi:hypothetical protein